MMFASPNLLAVPVAALAGFLVGGLWYGLLANQWMSATGLSEQQIKVKTAQNSSSPIPFITAALANLVMAFVLSIFILNVPPFIWPNALDGGSLIQAMQVCALVWLGFVATTLSVNYGFQMKPFKLTLIDAGHWLLVILVMGAIITLFGASDG